MPTITAKKPDGLWRCGVFHPAAPVAHAAVAFTAEQWARLKAEPLLTVAEQGPTDAPRTGTDGHGQPPRKPRKAKG